MRIQALELSEQWLTAFDGANPPIRTVEDLLNRYWESALVDDLKRFGVTEEEIEALICHISSTIGDEGATLEQELHSKCDTGVVCSSGASEVDELLVGSGFVGGEVTELIGLSGSGKTHMCMTAAAACAAEGKSVIFLSSSNSFSHAHLCSIVKQRVKEGLAGMGGELEDEVKPILSRISLTTAFDVFTVLRLLDSLNRQLEAGSNSANVRLLVVDSAHALVNQLVTGQNSEYGRSLMLRCLPLLPSFLLPSTPLLFSYLLLPTFSRTFLSPPFLLASSSIYSPTFLSPPFLLASSSIYSPTCPPYLPLLSHHHSLSLPSSPTPSPTSSSPHLYTSTSAHPPPMKSSLSMALRQLAVAHQVAVLVTNNLVVDSSGTK
jgi:hypothetical protein